MTKKIILVHGLGGASDGTWGNFPNFLQDDKDLEFDVVSVGYKTSFWKIWQRGPGILNIANGVLSEIRARCDLENDEIVLAGHSLGGIIVKKILLLLANKRISHKIIKVCFFDVPHDGSGFANAGKYILIRNRHLKSLCRDSAELDDLNDQWISSRLDDTLDVLSIIAADDSIVSSSSSKSIFRAHDVETINNVNHVTIVKPDSPASLVYVVFKNFILKKKTVSKYKNNASRDYEDWKRVERNHSYFFAIDDGRARNFKALVESLVSVRAVIRLTGASGLGKTRLLLEAIEASKIDHSCVLRFDAPGYDTKIKECVRQMVDDGVHALVVVENCNIGLHNELAKEVNSKACFLKVVTVGYSDEQVDDSTHIQLSPLSNEAINQILSPILVGLDWSDVDRVARFAQGYPLIATLIAEQYQKEGKLLGSIERSSVVKKLIDGDGGITNDEKDVLYACSLFDVFGTAEGAAGEEAKFIAENIANSNMIIFERVLKKFASRQIINRAGRYARLVPKPLALTLASEWWEETSYDRQKKLIDTLPDSLLQSFCTQASYLDGQASVQRFSDRLFGGQSPFVQAEELLTERGSKLFRAFVEVNPESTSDALYRVLSKLNHDQLQSIDGYTRRNLVWALEKLCFHATVFERSAWCMLLLASAENEQCSNNATGMFAQLFRVNLSGTQAKPRVRFDVLERAIAINHIDVDMVVLEALNQAITQGHTRAIGAEYQGTKAPLKEWQPELWQDIFDFWHQAFELMLALFGRGDAQKEKVLSAIGNSIGGFVVYGRFEMLDAAIRKIISINGRYWPAALNSIKNIFEYSSQATSQEANDVLHAWLELLSTEGAELPDKLRILVTNPPWETHKGEDGRYIDVAAENAKVLAREVSQNIAELLPHLHLLLKGEQKQSYPFGYQLAHELNDVVPVLSSALDCLVAIEKPDSRLVLGLYRGLFEKSPALWQENIDRLVADEKFVCLYPDLMRTGDIKKTHLDKLLDLIQLGVLSPNSANLLSYGNVTGNLEPDVLAGFCLGLAELGDQATWPALNVIYMYCFSNECSFETLRIPLKKLVSAVPLHKVQAGTHTAVGHWYDLASKLMTIQDSEFAIALTNQLIAATKYGLNHSDIWAYTKPLLLDLMREYSTTLWPILADAIVQSEGSKRYWLQQLLDREISVAVNMPSVFSVIPVPIIIDWCNEQPDIGPGFIASCVNVLETIDGQLRPSALFVELLEQFGECQGVSRSLEANMDSGGWSGSRVPYLKSDKEALYPLLDHKSNRVRNWVKDRISYIDRQITEELKRDEEWLWT